MPHASPREVREQVELLLELVDHLSDRLRRLGRRIREWVTLSADAGGRTCSDLRASVPNDEIVNMTAKALWDEILRLPVEERLKLVQDIWDSIAASPADVPVPEWYKAELDRRLDHPDPGPNLSWDQVRERLRGPE